MYVYQAFRFDSNMRLAKTEKCKLSLLRGKYVSAGRPAKQARASTTKLEPGQAVLVSPAQAGPDSMFFNNKYHHLLCYALCETYCIIYDLFTCLNPAINPISLSGCRGGFLGENASGANLSSEAKPSLQETVRTQANTIRTQTETARTH